MAPLEIDHFLISHYVARKVQQTPVLLPPRVRRSQRRHKTDKIVKDRKGDNTTSEGNEQSSRIFPVLVCR